MKTVFMYAGQGSQFYHMGESFYAEDENFRKNADEFDALVFAKKGFHLKEIIFDSRKKKSSEFSSLLESNLAIVWFEYAATKMLIARGICPDYLLGSSLGEITSAVVSGAVKLETMIDLIIKLSETIESNIIPGGMVAVFAGISIYDEMPHLFKGCEIVSVNHAKHFVVSGGKHEITTLCNELDKQGILFKELSVDFPFHTALMDAIKDEVISNFEEVKISQPCYETYSCADKGSIKKIDAEYFWRVVRQPIQLRQCIDLFEKQECIYVDISANGELAGVLKSIIKDKTNAYLLSSPFISKPNVENLVGSLKKKVGTSYKAYVFPGQGAQKAGMGKDVFEEFPEYVQKADRILGYSIKDLCLNDSQKLLGKTEYTQPALYVVSTLSYLKAMKEGKKKPSYLAGHSIGEYAALFAAGVFDFETGLRIVQKRGKLMSQVKDGGMAAILGTNEEAIRNAIAENYLDTIDIANLNTPNQTIIAGPKEDIAKAENIMQTVEGFRKYVVLDVSGPFHSRYMGLVKEEFKEFLKEIKFNKPSIHVVANLTARPYGNKDIIEVLTEHLVNPVRWCESIRYILGKNATDIEQIGPGDVAIGLVATIKRRAKPLIVNDEEEIKDLKSVDSKLVDKESIDKGYKLGSKVFMKAYHTEYPLYIGGMYRAISSAKLVAKACNSGLLAFYGAGGCSLQTISVAIDEIKSQVTSNTDFGVNIPADYKYPQKTAQIIDLLLKKNVRVIEAAAFLEPTAELVKYRIKGLWEDHGVIKNKNKLIIKLSRPEIASKFANPPAQTIIKELLEAGDITKQEALYAQNMPVASDICVEADSGGHTDRSNLFATLPTIRRTVIEMNEKYHYSEAIRIGAGGGMGTPESVAAAFIMNSDFVTTGSINHCTVEAGTSDAAKSLLEQVDIQDTEYIPVMEAFESSSKVQVVKKGTLFPMRANKLCSLSQKYQSFEEMDEATLNMIEKTIFKQKITEVVAELKEKYGEEFINRLTPKQLMLRVIKWYLHSTNEWAIKGNEKQGVNYQIPCGSSMGSFNKWVLGSKYEKWQTRHVDEINKYLMEETQKYMFDYLNSQSV